MAIYTGRMKVVMLRNGRFVKEFEYSQGYKDVIECDTPWSAHNYADGKGNIDFVVQCNPGSIILEGTVVFDGLSKLH